MIHGSLISQPFDGIFVFEVEYASDIIKHFKSGTCLMFL